MPQPPESPSTQSEEIERLRAENQRLKNSLKAANDLISVAPAFFGQIDLQGRVQIANELSLQLIGETLESVAGQLFWEALWWRGLPDSAKRVHDAFERGLQGQSSRFDLQHWAKTETEEGEVRWVTFSLTPEKNAVGEVVRIGVSGIDITDRLQALRDRDELMSLSSHELRTPITGLKLHFELAKRSIELKKEDALHPERFKQLIEQGDRQLNRLTRLIDDMFDYSSIKMGKLLIEKKPINFSRTVADTVERLTPHLQANGCQVTIRIEPEIEVQGDEGRLEQAISNFLTNATRYGKGQPVVVTLTRSKSESALLQVTDYGRGLAEEDHARVFDKFERAVTGSEISGLGLGLFITREILHAHDGKVWVESKLGEGATFFAQIPLFTGFATMNQ